MKQNYKIVCLVAASASLVAGCVMVSYGSLKPVSPKNGSYLMGKSDSLQPTFEWEDKAPGGPSTYDLGVWEVIKKKFQVFDDGTPVYSRGDQVYLKENIQGTSFRMEVPLKPAAKYYWSVRRTGADQWATYNGNAALPGASVASYGEY